MIRLTDEQLQQYKNDCDIPDHNDIDCIKEAFATLQNYMQYKPEGHRRIEECGLIACEIALRTIAAQSATISQLQAQVRHEQQFCKQMVKLKCACRTAEACKCTNNAVGCKAYCAEPIEAIKET